MKISKFKVLLYLKKMRIRQAGQGSPIMGRITLNHSNLFACQSKNSMAQFSCKLSCNPKLWNSRSSRLDGKPCGDIRQESA